MVFAELFFTFLKIGLFTFGGGYSMVALIEDEVVSRHSWMTAQEFTDILAVSQMTPGPIGINTATYAGYTAVVGQGLPQWQGVIGALIASLAVVLLVFASKEQTFQVLAFQEDERMGQNASDWLQM